MVNSAEVFTPLAADYARYRPGYPTELLDEIAAVCGMQPTWQIADIGSGTGNLARLFLQAGYQVVGVEPNRENARGRRAPISIVSCLPQSRWRGGTHSVS